MVAGLLVLMVDGLTWSWLLREGSAAGFCTSSGDRQDPLPDNAPVDIATVGVSGRVLGAFRAANGGGGAGEELAVL